jgi:Cd2+/Zn2+-exporting ATPase
VQGVCCASEVPSVRRILRPHHVQINIATKRIYVTHNASVASAQELANNLSRQGFSATVISNGNNNNNSIRMIGNNNNLLLDDQPRSAFVESTVSFSNCTLTSSELQATIQKHFLPSHVRDVLVHAPSRTAKLQHNPGYVTCDDIVQALEASCGGGESTQFVVVINGAEENLYLPLELTNDTTIAFAEERSLLHIHVVLSGIFWVASLLSAIPGLHNLEYFGLLSVAFGLPPVLIKAMRTMRRREFDANCMMMIAAIGALALGEMDEAASVAFLFSVSEYLESRATERARKALEAIVRLRPDHANVIHPETKEIIVLAADKVPVGSLISVRMGDKIVADGVVVEGTSSVDESSLTGESAPVNKSPDDTVSGGTINVGATRLIVRTTSSVDDSAVSRLIRLVEDATSNRSPTEKMIDGFARTYTPTVISMAVFMATVPWIFGVESGRYWTLNALIIIVIACPCALTISTPITYAAGLAATAQRGIIVKGGASLEALGNVKTVLLDKTGTLTQGKFAVSHLEVVGANRSREEMLTLLALMEAPASHPMSATLVAAAKKEGTSLASNVEVKEHQILKGEGVQATILGKLTYVGNRRLFERLGMFAQLQENFVSSAKDWGRQGGTVGFLGVEGEGIIGAFSMNDCVRPESKETVSALQSYGLTVIMLTGDGEGAAKAVAKHVGILESDVHSRLLPEDKLHFVGSFKRPGGRNAFGLCVGQPKVMFVGDGVNDGKIVYCFPLNLNI